MTDNQDEENPENPPILEEVRAFLAHRQGAPDRLQILLMGFLKGCMTDGAVKLCQLSSRFVGAFHHGNRERCQKHWQRPSSLLISVRDQGPQLIMIIILVSSSSTAVVSAMSLFALYRDHRTLREISIGGHYNWFLRLGGVADSRALTPFVPLSGIVEKGMVETSSRKPGKANDIVGEEPDAAMQEGGNPMAEPGESGSDSADQLQPQLQEAASRAVKTLLDGHLRVYLEEVRRPM